MGDQSARKDARNRMVKVVFASMTLVCLAAGLAVYLFAEQLGFSESTARFVAIAFLAAGVADYIVLKFWDRIAARR